MEDRSISTEVRERSFFRDAFKHQHRKRVRVGGHCMVGITTFDEFGGGIPENGRPPP